MTAEAQRWAHTMARQLTTADLPIFGSPAWEAALGPVRLASALRAAVAWMQDSDPHRIAARLDLELQAGWRAAEQDYESWRDVAGRVRRQADEPSHQELQRRRAS